MATRVQFSYPQKGINVTKAMVPPIKVGDLDAWFKQARKTIPDIPKSWYRDDELVTTDTIIFKLICRQTRDKCAVVIQRK